MKQINVHEAKARLSEILVAVEEGESVVICRRNHPIAELRPLPKKPTQPRPIGLARDEFEIPAGFFDPLPDDLLDLFEGSA